jgi:hypothetical protein
MGTLAAFLLCFLILRGAGTDGFGLLVGVGAIALVVLIVVFRSMKREPPPEDLAFSAPIDHTREVSYADFEDHLRDLIDKSGCERHFYTTVAGPSHPNPDGTSRTGIISRCKVAETIELRPEPENPFGHDAMAFHRLTTGEQLGYLNKELSPEVAGDFRKYGPCWLGILRRHNHHPETGKVVGATICLLRLPTEKLVEEEETERAAAK